MADNSENLLIADNFTEIVEQSNDETWIEQAWQWYVDANSSRTKHDQHQPICTRVYIDDDRWWDQW